MPVLPPPKGGFEISVPILIIGAGACGLVAGMTAKEAGAEVMVLERDAKPTGSSTLSTCLIPAAGTKLQKKEGVADTPEKFAADLIAKAKNKNDADMALWVAQESAPTVDWLMETVGMPLSLLTGFKYPGHSEYRMHGSPNRTGQELMAVLPAAAERMGVDVATSALVTDIFADESARVHGVRLTRPDGATEDIGCDVLVLACNGFGGNPEMLREYIPEIADAPYFGHVGNKGDAVKWGMALGGAVKDMGGYQGHGAVAHPLGVPVMWGVLTEGGFQVNLKGERFSNETLGYSEQAMEVARQPDQLAWDIFDHDAYLMARDFADFQHCMEMNAVKEGNTVEELAKATNLPVEALKKTFAEVEALSKGKAKDTWGRDFTQKPFLEPPFHAIKVTGALFHTQGGLVVDSQARVLRENGTPLPNLFAGGGAARGLSGPSRWGYLSGNGLLTATVLGRLAGRYAAKQVLGK